MRLAVAPDLDAVIVLGGCRRDVTRPDIPLDQLQRSPCGRSVAATAAGLDANQVARLERMGVLLVDAFGLVRSGLADRETAGLGLTPALPPPRRTQRAIEIGAEIAGRQDPIDLAESQAAAKRAGAGGILAQREFLDAERQQPVLPFPRGDPGIA